MPFAFWVHDLNPFLIRFSENFGIRYYGLAYLAGFAAALGMLHLYFKRGRSAFNLNATSDLMTYLVVGVLAGGRLGYFFLYQLHSLGTDPLILFRVWEGGMASHGAFIGVLLSLWWWARKQNVPLFQVSDLIVSTAPVGLFFGRIANFINGELVGRVSAAKWAVIFPNNEFDRGVRQALPRHPSQLYEAALEGLLLLALMQVRVWGSDVLKRQPGRLSGEFLVAYAAVRMYGEQFREPDASLLFGLSRGSFYSIFVLIAGCGLIAHAIRKSRAA
jgi:phosphatidylglycerol:prolipoprotein diacylglycerol transferase